jgi:glycosyltransferase involved in cell wall biosynthesis
MKVLVLLGDRPNPPITGSRVRNSHLWPAVAKAGVEVRVVGLDLYGKRSEPARMPDGIDAEFIPPTRRSALVRAAASFALPYHMNPYVESISARVDSVVRDWRPDLVHAEELRMARYLPAARGRRNSVPQSVTLHNVESELYAAIGRSVFPMARRISTRIQTWNLRRFELLAVRSADVAFAYSTRDRLLYEALAPGANWSETRNGADVTGIVPAPQPTDASVLLIGAWDYGPNHAGLVWFLDEIRPKLPTGARITIAGSGADEPLKAKIIAAGARFVDTPPDLTSLYAEHGVVVVPVLQGSGTRGKILEALAHERVVVTTTKGPEGLELAEGEGIVVADGAEPFARAMREVMMSPDSRAAIARKGRDAVMARYDWPVVARGLVEAWTRCISR